MAYLIFLKSLESLEDFMKNLHVQIPSKSLFTKFQTLPNSKIQFKIQKETFLSLSFKQGKALVVTFR
jgi:hypothetical protein